MATTREKQCKDDCLNAYFIKIKNLKLSLPNMEGVDVFTRDQLKKVIPCAIVAGKRRNPAQVAEWVETFCSPGHKPQNRFFLNNQFAKTKRLPPKVVAALLQYPPVLLPYFYPVFGLFIQFLSWLHVKSLVPGIHIHRGTNGSVGARRMGVGKNELCGCLG